MSASLNKTMKARHLIMLSLGGAIGTGLFLSSGEVINQAGAVGAVIAYIIGASVTYMVMMCLGELSAHMPVSNAFSAYATRYIGPATGYVIAWVYWLAWALTLGVDFTAAAILMTEWFPQFPIWIWVLIFSFFILAINLYSTKAFAEFEFYLALIKVIAVIVFLIIGVSVVLNFLPVEGSHISSHALALTENKAKLLPNGIWPIITTMLLVSFSFTGTELIAVAAGETENPSETIPKAIKATFWRLLIMFIGTIIVMSLIFSPHELGIEGSISSSPFVMLFEKIKIPHVEDIMRFVIITALLSSANAGLYGASRMMWSLSNENLIPRWLSLLNKRNVPIYAVIVTIIGGLPGLFLKYFKADVVLNNLMDIASFTMVLVWMSICLSQFNFRKQYIKSGNHVKDLAYCSPLYPYLSIVGLIFLSITALSMVVNTSKLYGFSFCIIFVSSCYAYYFFRRKPI